MENSLLKKILFQHVNKKQLYNIFALTSSNILKYAVNIFLSVIIIRYLGASLFGVFSYVHSITSIVSVFSSLGLQSIVVKEIVLKEKPLGKILGSSLFLSFLSGFFAAIFQFIIVIILNPGEKIVLNLCLINSFIFLFDTLKIYTYYYEAEVKSRIVARINNFTLIVTSILKVIAVYLNLGIYSIALIYVLDYVITGFLLYFIFSKENFSYKYLDVSKSICFDLLNKSFPLILSGLFISVYMKIDQVMIKNILGNKEAGVFSVVVRLTEIWYFIPVIIQSTLFPDIIKRHQSNETSNHSIQKLYKILILFSLVVILLMSFFGGVIIKLLFGEEFIAASMPLLISIWALLFVSIGVARNAYIMSYNLNKLYLYSTIIGAILNLVLNFLLIKRIGIVGASVATFISQLVSSHLSSIFFSKLKSQFHIVNKVFINIITFNIYK